jgi:aryl-alcohol dehydrogenase
MQITAAVVNEIGADFTLEEVSLDSPDADEVLIEIAALSRNGTPIGSNFFGQSSLATHAIANQRNVVKISDKAPLALVGPLGCGVQTGAGAVLGGGSVGLSAALAAVVRELATIIVVEPMARRRDLALSLGATHTIDPARGPIAEQVRGIVPNGVNYAIDTTALLPVLEQAVSSMAQRGRLGLLGVPADATTVLPLSLIHSQITGLTVTGIVEGDSDPDRFIPELLELHRAGRFPFDRLITTMPFARINEAVAAQQRGDAVKIVLFHD